MQQNAKLVEINNTLAMESIQPSPIEILNMQVLDVIASIKSTGNQLFEKACKIDEKLNQVEAQFQQHMLQSSQRIYNEIERSKDVSTNSLNEVRQIWETKLKDTSEIYACENRKMIDDGKRTLSESIDKLNGDSEKALNSYVNRLEAQLAEAKEKHNSLIEDFKKQISYDFESFIKETRQELDSAKERANEVFDRKLETLLNSLSDSKKEIENNKTIIERFIEQIKLSLQSMVGEFQGKHDVQINQTAIKLGELESQTNNFVKTMHSRFETRWLDLVNTHNQNIKSFRDGLKEAIVAKVAYQAKKRLDSTIKEFQPVLDHIINSQEALRLEILALSEKNQNNHIQNLSVVNKMQDEFNIEKKKGRLWILFLTLFFSAIFIYSHYFSW
jgi:F0F1-type ATP synthase membrane subunit b/b'